MTGDEQLSRFAGALFAWAQWTYSWHRAVFIGLNLLLTAINIWTGPPWWGIWPLLITGALFTLHYLIYKSSMVDDAWVDERAADLYDRSYDQGHIDSIAGQHGFETPIDQKSREVQERGRRSGWRGGKAEDG
jgi:hypothetical protein